MAVSAKSIFSRETHSASPGLNGPAPPSAALEAVGARPRRTQRRPTKQASYELCNHAKVYLENREYANGYDFLHSLLAAGTSISTPAQPYIGFIAPPAYIALAASLIAYPKITTRTRSRDHKKGSDAALRYLRCIHTTVDGPAYPAVRKGLIFPEELARRRAPAYRSAAASSSPEPAGDIERLAGDAANAESLWVRAEDFWHIVGWAFNCSRVHKKRWARWKPWLGMMLDFLEADWEFCLKRSQEEGTESEATLQESLLWYYIIGKASSPNRGVRRRIVRAILATASNDSLKDYPQIWEEETEGPPRKAEDKRQVDTVDFETGEMADYGSDEVMQDAPSEKSAEEEDSSAECDNGSIDDLHDAARNLGGMDAIDLRQRFIALLAQVAEKLPTEFTTLSDFYDNVLEDFIQLPTITFKLLLSTSKLPGWFHIAFCANLLLPLVSGTIPDYFHYDPIQEHFERTLLLLKSTNRSFAANAKISLILEQMVLYMVGQETLLPTESLRAALEAGIEARHGQGNGKRGTREEGQQARATMEACSKRLLSIVELLEMAGGEALQPLREEAQDNPAYWLLGTDSSLSPAPETSTEEDD